MEESLVLEDHGAHMRNNRPPDARIVHEFCKGTRVTLVQIQKHSDFGDCTLFVHVGPIAMRMKGISHIVLQKTQAFIHGTSCLCKPAGSPRLGNVGTNQSPQTFREGLGKQDAALGFPSIREVFAATSIRVE